MCHIYFNLYVAFSFQQVQDPNWEKTLPTLVYREQWRLPVDTMGIRLFFFWHILLKNWTFSCHISEESDSTFLLDYIYLAALGQSYCAK